MIIKWNPFNVDAATDRAGADDAAAPFAEASPAASVPPAADASLSAGGGDVSLSAGAGMPSHPAGAGTYAAPGGAADASFPSGAASGSVPSGAVPASRPAGAAHAFGPDGAAAASGPAGGAAAAGASATGSPAPGGAGPVVPGPHASAPGVPASAGPASGLAVSGAPASGAFAAVTAASVTPVAARPSPALASPAAAVTAVPEEDFADLGTSLDMLASGLGDIGGVLQSMALASSRLKAMTRGIETLAERHAAAEIALDRTRGDLNVAAGTLAHHEVELRRRAEEIDHLAQKCARADAETGRLEGHGRALADENERLYVEKTRLEERLHKLETLLRVARSDLGVVARERDQLRAANGKHALALEERDRSAAERDIRIAAMSTAAERLTADLLAKSALVEAHDRRIGDLGAETRRQRAEIDRLTLALRTAEAVSGQETRTLRARLSEAEAAAEGLRAKMAFLEQSAETARGEARDLSARSRLLSDSLDETLARSRAQADEILRLKAERAGVPLPSAAGGGGGSTAGSGARPDAAARSVSEAGGEGVSKAGAGGRPEAGGATRSAAQSGPPPVSRSQAAAGADSDADSSGRTPADDLPAPPDAPSDDKVIVLAVDKR